MIPAHPLIKFHFPDLAGHLRCPVVGDAQILGCGAGRAIRLLMLTIPTAITVPFQQTGLHRDIAGAGPCIFDCGCQSAGGAGCRIRQGGAESLVEAILEKQRRSSTGLSYQRQKQNRTTKPIQPVIFQAEYTSATCMIKCEPFAHRDSLVRVKRVNSIAFMIAQ